MCSKRFSIIVRAVASTYGAHSSQRTGFKHSTPQTGSTEYRVEYVPCEIRESSLGVETRTSARWLTSRARMWSQT